MSKPTIKKYYSSFRREAELKLGLLTLFVQQTPNLIEALYQMEGLDPELRVGLTIKILHNTPSGTRFSLATLERVVRDIENMIKDHNYLRSTGAPRIRLHCLRNELDLVQGYIDLDEKIALNCGQSDLTFQDSLMNTEQASETIDLNTNQEIDDQQSECLLM